MTDDAELALLSLNFLSFILSIIGIIAIPCISDSVSVSFLVLGILPEFIGRISIITSSAIYLAVFLALIFIGLVLGYIDTVLTTVLFNILEAGKKQKADEQHSGNLLLACDRKKVAMYSLISLCEEVLRAFVILLLWHCLGYSLFVSIVTSAVLIGILHINYGVYSVPPKVVDSFFLGVLFYTAGIIGSLLTHIAINIYILCLEINF